MIHLIKNKIINMHVSLLAFLPLSLIQQYYFIVSSLYNSLEIELMLTTTVGFIRVIWTIIGHPVASIIPIDAGAVTALEFLRRASGIYNTYIKIANMNKDLIMSHLFTKMSARLNHMLVHSFMLKLCTKDHKLTDTL